MTKKINRIEQPRQGFGWKKIIMFLLTLWILSFFVSLLFLDDDGIESGNVAVINIKGVISNDASSGGFVQSTSANPETIIDLIDKAENNPEVKAVLFDINSGGGSPVATDEISRRILKLNKTSVALIRDVGASGAYWIASSADAVFANRMSIVGSIGVTGAYLSFEGLLDDYNVTYNRLVAGKYKDIGSPFKEITSEEETIIQSLLDEFRDEFITHISTNRGMSEEKVRALATGEFWSGARAKELGLVDMLGSRSDVEEYLEEFLNETVEFAEYKRPTSIRDLLNVASSGFGKSIGEGISKNAYETEAKKSIII
ncbi:signal peptide peptidase SppA [Candidatus Woesearchaeota archaeon]|nr:signal peptide peptidase SppA [Candidatus Woesearchaeota archaeon]